jgi:osmotically inducible protein OsmC
VAIDSHVTLVPTNERSFKLAVELDVTLPSVTDPVEAEAMVREAHRLCPFSNAIRGNVDVTMIVNGRDIDGTSTATAA